MPARSARSSFSTRRNGASARRLIARLGCELAGTPFAAGLVGALEALDGGRPDSFVVLAYHRIGYPDAPSRLDPRMISATPEAFEAQVAHLAAHRDVVSLDDLLELRRRGRSFRRCVVAVTFDDGYRDFAEHAWPTLRAYALPATLFVPTAYPDHPERAFWWDRLHAALTGTASDVLSLGGESVPVRTGRDRAQALRGLTARVKRMEHAAAMALVGEVEAALGAAPAQGHVLGWDELRRLASEGVTIGAHTRSHPLLPHVEPHVARAEIAGSLEDLERELGAAPPALAYPDGQHDDVVVAAARSAGIELAFTTRRGKNEVGHLDWLRLARVNVGSRASLSAVRMQLLSRPHLKRAPVQKAVC